ncbi:flavin monoamine oxidase family protein [Nocardia tengchongensis]|uniref:flavin monoamine oxidase family protein n=1 Tax=Nocardia tengchongensis TaxID=2055889 RepID=UPI0036C1E466
MSEFDVVVVGAGLAGATVARECATRGMRTVVLEGRDRVGGRAWTTKLSSGEPIDIGGTYFSWNQPHIWSEITRYGLVNEVVPSNHEPAEWALAPRGDGLEWCTIEEHVQREMPLLERFFEQSYEVFPRPYDPLHARDEVAKLDHMTVRDRLDQLDFPPDDAAMVGTLLTTLAGDTNDKTSFVTMLHWWASAGHNYVEYYSDLQNSKLERGIASLVELMLADGGAELRLSSPVAEIASDREGVRVSLASGETVTGLVVVVATPTGVWPYLDFSPALSADRLAAAREGMQVHRGSKSVAVIRGESRIFACTPLTGHPITAIWTTHQLSDNEQVVALLSSPAMNNPEDPAEVGAAIADLLPGTELLELHSSNFGPDDEFTRGAWCMLKPGQLTRIAPHETLTKPEGRVVFATSDIASNWNSFLDGAIESGLHAAREVRNILG